MQELFRKCLDNQCSPDELKILLAYFNNPESETQFRKLILESLEDTTAEDDGNQWQETAHRLREQIEKKIMPSNGKVVPFFRKGWVRIAAAVILLAGIFFLYNYFNHNSTVQETAKVDAPANEIGPGGNKAIVTLADGTNINLEKALNDTVAKEGSTSLVKLADGELSYNLLKGKTAPLLYNSVTTPRSGQYQLSLSDGSKIWLNAASSIRFPVVFTGSERIVELTGEAYFEVATLRLRSGQSMPFKVKMANKAEVEVLGTHFSINAYIDEPTINTTLLEGSVKVTDLVHDRSKVIVPGEQAQLGANDQIKINKQVNVEQAIAWKNGIFNFSHADLEMSLRQIARWYDVDIIFQGSIPQKKFNGQMQRSLNLSQVIKLLETSGVDCRIEGKKLIVAK